MKKPKTRQFEVTEGRQLKTVCLTPTWAALVPALLDAYANAEPVRRETIREEFLLMAKAADIGASFTGLDLPAMDGELAELRRIIPRSSVGEIVAQIDTLRKKLKAD